MHSLTWRQTYAGWVSTKLHEDTTKLQKYLPPYRLFTPVRCVYRRSASSPQAQRMRTHSTALWR